MTQLSCASIGIEGCDFVATSEAGGGADVIEQMVKHLRKEHKIKLSPQDVTEGDLSRLEEAERMVAARIRGELQLQP